MCSVSVTCPLCAQTSFPSIDSLRISLIKAANGPLTCPICRDILLGLDKLTIHLFSHTNLIADSDCIGDCSSPFTVKTEGIEEKCPIDVAAPANLKASTSDLLATQPKCDTCGVPFRTLDLLHMHNKVVHQIPGETLTTPSNARYQCHLCAKIFKMRGSLRVHLKVVHLLGLPSNSNTSKLRICDNIKQQGCDNISPGISSDPQNATIPVCGNLTTHAVTESQLKSQPEVNNCDAINNSEKKPQQDNVRGIESSKVWECEICSKSFTTKYFLKKHKRLHTGEMPYTCEICGKTFTFQQSYHKHLLYHSDEKPHVCQTCSRAFKELSTLHNHERIHSGEKPFKCETCGKCFRQRVSYLVHKRIHTGAMPYKCHACTKSFRYKVSQRTHKCTAQSSESCSTPATDILQKLLHSTSILPEDNNNIPEEAIGLSNLSKFSSKSEFNEEMLTKSIDDIVAESCTKMGIGTSNLFNLNNNEDRISSPSEGFQNLCLYSPATEPICEDTFKQFLYSVSDHL